MLVPGMAPSLPRRIGPNQIWGVPEFDATDTIGMLECGNDVIGTLHVRKSVTTVVLYDDGQRWPDVQHLPHRCLVRAPKLQIQAMC
jgi:hypothetical protein